LSSLENIVITSTVAVIAGFAAVASAIQVLWSRSETVRLEQGSGTYGSSGDDIWLADNFELKKKIISARPPVISLSRQITAEVMSGPFFKDVFVLLLN